MKVLEMANIASLPMCVQVRMQSTFQSQHGCSGNHHFGFVTNGV